jgi:hypothetical protein
MSDRQIKDAISKFLRECGFEVTQVPEGPHPSPDLLVTKSQRYLIEIKTKEDDPAVIADRARRLRAGEVVDSGAAFTPQSTMSRIIRDGVKQLEAYPARERDFCLLWLLAVGSDLESQYQQFLGTLYGLTNLVGPDSLTLMSCYYFRNSAFFRWQNLDGAIVGTMARGELCINSYSPRGTSLKESSLAQIFGTAVTDPRKREVEGRAYIADCDVDRRDEQQLLQYLQTKYRRPALMAMDLGTVVPQLSLQPDEEGNEVT